MFLKFPYTVGQILDWTVSSKEQGNNNGVSIAPFSSVFLLRSNTKQVFSPPLSSFVSLFSPFSHFSSSSRGCYCFSLLVSTFSICLRIRHRDSSCCLSLVFSSVFASVSISISCVFRSSFGDQLQRGSK